MNPLITIPYDNTDYPWKEWHLQAVVCQFLERGGYTFAGDMNAGKRGKLAAMQAKLTGLTAGETDLRIYLPGGKLVSLEVKTKDGYLSKTQKNRHNVLRNLGFYVKVIKASCPKEAVKKVIEALEEFEYEFDTNENSA